MTLQDLKMADRVIGVKQVTKAIGKDLVSEVFLASDADERVIKTLEAVCQERMIPVQADFTMSELGKACGIEVRAAAAAALKQGWLITSGQRVRGYK